ncbi:uncharacterized protein [Oryctolagus cuniculus]|uniref:uncharacterized protein isoform X1 n=1 Tax=Oryctolagus cuniculus TaxID=9986 RepID=UPI0038795C97
MWSGDSQKTDTAPPGSPQGRRKKFVILSLTQQRGTTVVLGIRAWDREDTLGCLTWNPKCIKTPNSRSSGWRPPSRNSTPVIVWVDLDLVPVSLWQLLRGDKIIFPPILGQTKAEQVRMVKQTPSKPSPEVQGVQGSGGKGHMRRGVTAAPHLLQEEASLGFSTRTRLRPCSRALWAPQWTTGLSRVEPAIHWGSPSEVLSLTPTHSLELEPEPHPDIGLGFQPLPKPGGEPAPLIRQ